MARRFQTTQWSLVLASRGASTASREALGQLFQAYWHPLYSFVRRHGHDAESARDLLQGYFLQVMEKDYFGGVAPEKGRFRSFLVVSLRRYLNDQKKRRHAQKRSPSSPLVPLDEDRDEHEYRQIPIEGLDPEQVFERRWAAVVLDRAWTRLEDDERRGDRSEQFALLRPHLLDGTGLRYEEIASRTGSSPAAIKVTVHRLRRRFGRYVREEVAATVARPSDVDAELRHLLNIASAAGGLTMVKTVS